MFCYFLWLSIYWNIQDKKITTRIPSLTLVMLNKLRCHAHANFQPIRLLDPGCWYEFKYWMANSTDLDQLAASSTLCKGRAYLGSAWQWLVIDALLKMWASQITHLTHTAPSKFAADESPFFFLFFFFVCFFVREAKTWYFMWIICYCLADDSPEISSLIFYEE